VIEIYNERIRDLLDPAKENLQVRRAAPAKGVPALVPPALPALLPPSRSALFHFPTSCVLSPAATQVTHDRERGIVVANATAQPVANERDCVELMQRGIAARAVSATAMNAGSSRSHCVVYLIVERAFADGRIECGKLCLVVRVEGDRREWCVREDVWGPHPCTQLPHLQAGSVQCGRDFLAPSKPNIPCHLPTATCLPACWVRVQDLAGSERQDKTAAVGLTAVEGSQINKSLSALGNVVNALTDPRGKAHVPFRSVAAHSTQNSHMQCQLHC
jgi:hypothetical protein